MTEANHEWSSWFDHTPGPCPVPVGALVSVVYDNFTSDVGKCTDGPSWSVEPGDPHIVAIIRYRYRITSAYRDIERLAETPVTDRTLEPVQ